MNKTHFIAGWMHCCNGGNLTDTSDASFVNGYNVAWVRLPFLPSRRAELIQAAEYYVAEEEQRVLFCAQSKARMAKGLCITTRDGKGFSCNNRLSAERLADGCGCCAACEQREIDMEGYCDGESARRMEGRMD